MHRQTSLDRLLEIRVHGWRNIPITLIDQGSANFSSDHAGLPLAKFGELRERTLPSSILLYKNVCRPLLRGEDLPVEFTLGFRQSGDHRSVSVDANSRVVGLHHFVGQST